jgi:cation-transporting ATPase E
MKTFFAITLSLFCVITGTAYPFDTRGMLLFEMFIDGMPSVILAFQPNDRLIEGRFIRVVLKKCIPSGLTILLSVVAVVLLNNVDGFFALSENGNPHEFWTTCVLALAASGFAALCYLCYPYTKLRVGCVAFAFFGVALCTVLAPFIPGLGGLCGVYLHSGRVFLITAIVFVGSLLAVLGIDRLFRLIGKRTAKAVKS